MLEITLEETSSEERARACEVADESGLFEDGTVETTNEGISVTSNQARRSGADLLIALRDAGFTVVGFDVRSPTLDDVFLAITGEPPTEGDQDEERIGEDRTGDVAEAEVTR